MHALNRRVFIMKLVAAGAVLGAQRASGADPKLKESDPEATAVAYSLDAGKVDKARFPKKAAGDHCGACKAYLGKAADDWANCALIDDKVVSKAGWCSSFVAKK